MQRILPSSMIRHGIPMPNGPALGMALALDAYSLLSWQDAAVKWLVATVPIWQVLFVRSAAALAASHQPMTGCG